MYWDCNNRGSTRILSAIPINFPPCKRGKCFKPRKVTVRGLGPNPPNVAGLPIARVNVIQPGVEVGPLAPNEDIDEFDDEPMINDGE